jgi:hypothetical protein
MSLALRVVGAVVWTTTSKKGSRRVWSRTMRRRKALGYHHLLRLVVRLEARQKVEVRAGQALRYKVMAMQMVQQIQKQRKLGLELANVISETINGNIPLGIHVSSLNPQPRSLVLP